MSDRLFALETIRTMNSFNKERSINNKLIHNLFYLLMHFSTVLLMNTRMAGLFA